MSITIEEAKPAASNIPPKHSVEVLAEKMIGSPVGFAKNADWYVPHPEIPWKFHKLAKHLDHGTYIDFSLWVGGINSVMRFSILCFPHCCAMAQLVGFSYHHHMSEAQVHAILDSIIRTELGPIGMYWKNNRMLIAMVENGCTEEPLVKLGDTPAQNLYAVKDQSQYTMKYNHYYTWFIKQQQSKTISCMKNENTGHRIHLVESIFR